MIIRMRNIGFANSPDGPANPGYRRDDQVHDGPKHENLNRAVPVAESSEKQTKDTIIQAEDQPRDQTRGQQMPGHAQESQNGNHREQTKKNSSSDVALQRETVEERDAIGHEHPGSEYQSQTHCDVHSDSNGHVPENVEPTVSG
jgi:hypothetical protein